MIPQDQPIKQHLIDETRIFISTSTPEGITKRWSLKLEGQLKPKPYDRKFEFGMVAAGRSKVCIYRPISLGRRWLIRIVSSLLMVNL